MSEVVGQALPGTSKDLGRKTQCDTNEKMGRARGGIAPMLKNTKKKSGPSVGPPQKKKREGKNSKRSICRIADRKKGARWGVERLVGAAR